MAYNTNGGIKVEDKAKLRVAVLEGNAATLQAGLVALIENSDVIFDISMTSKHGSSGLCMTVVYYLV